MTQSALSVALLLPADDRILIKDKKGNLTEFAPGAQSSDLMASSTAAHAQGRQAASALDFEFGGHLYPIAIPILSMAFLMMLGEQFLAMRGGQKPDWGRPFIRTAGFILLLAAYTPFSQGIIAAVKTVGSIEFASAERSKDGVLAKRAAAFKEMRQSLAEQEETLRQTQQAEEGGLVASVLPSTDRVMQRIESAFMTALDGLLYVGTWFSFTFAAFAIFALKIISGAVTRIILEVGPVMIAFAAVPGLTSRFLAGWCMALIEVTAWGAVGSILLRFLAQNQEKTMGNDIIDNQNYAEHVILNFVYAGLFLSVPMLTSMLFSGAASAVGSTGMAAAIGGLKAAGKRGGEAAGGATSKATAAAGSVARAAGNAALDAPETAGRIGDAIGAGATIQAAGAEARSTMMANNIADAKQEGRDLHAKRGAIEKQRRGD